MSNWYKNSNNSYMDSYGEEWITVTLNVDKFDKDWQKDEFYVGKNSSNAGVRSKYDFYKNLLSKDINKNIGLPEAKISDNGKIGLIDGRHRYAVMRDLGYKQIQFLVPSSQKDIFIKRYT
jgi:hypothetical protein